MCDKLFRNIVFHFPPFTLHIYLCYFLFPKTFFTKDEKQCVTISSSFSYFSNFKCCFQHGNMILITFKLQRNNFCKLNYAFLLTKNKEEGKMRNFHFLLFLLSLNVILTFLLILHFGLTRKFQKLYTIMILLNCFEQNFFSSNTAITNSFVTLPSQFSKFS